MMTKNPVSVICPAPLVSVLPLLSCLCWPDVRWQRFMFPAVSHTSSSATAEQQLDVYFTHSGWEEPSAHSDTFRGGSPFSNLTLWWWWSGWASPRLSPVGGGLWNKVKMPSPFCNWRDARPERPMSDTASVTLQLDSVQAGRQEDCTLAAEQDGGDVSGSCRREGGCQAAAIHRLILTHSVRKIINLHIWSKRRSSLQTE